MSWVAYSETVRRHLTSVASCTMLALLAIIAFGTAKFNTPGAVWPSLVSLLAIIIGCAPIGPEFSSGTLQLILVKPVNRSAYLLSRVFGVVTVIWIAALVACGAELLGRVVIGEPVQARIVGLALLNVAISSVLVVSLLTFFGTFTRAYFNVALYLVLQVGLGVAITVSMMGQRYPAVSRALQHVMKNVYPQEPQVFDERWMLLVVSNAAVALVLACFIFRRREVPYGGD